MTFDFSKPFYCCTTLKSDPLGFVEGNKDETYFANFKDAKAEFDRLTALQGKFAWMAELGSPKSNPEKIDWMYFRTTNLKLWEDLGVAESFREYRTHGVPEKSSFKFVDHYKSIEDLDKNSLKETT